MNFKACIDSRSIMGNGMLSIFLVMVLVYAMIWILSKTTNKKQG